MTRTVHHVPSVPVAALLRTLAVVSYLAAAAVLVACSTTEGFGKDVKHLGGGIENSAAKNK